ncbi:Alkaline phosphatase PafA precursor [compost metagenome]
MTAVEIEDIYLQLDKQLADFFAYLDNTVGKGNYTFFLTADHGASYNSRFYMDMKGNGGYFYSRQIISDLNKKLKEKFGQEKIVKSMMNYQVHLNNQIIDSLQLDRDKIKETIIRELRHTEGVAYVADMEKSEGLMIPEPVREKMINGYNYKRSGVIQIVCEPQWYDGTPRSTGTTHGTWSGYDSHIPLVFMGWGIKPGVSNTEVHIVDIAPTISSLLHITEPNGSIGKPITAVLGQ